VGGVADLFEAHARKIGLTVLGRESIDFKAQEFSALMTKIKRKNPDLIYFGGTTQTKAGQLAKDMVKVGMDRCKMMGPDGCYEDAMIQSAGADIVNDRFYVTFGGLTPDKLADTSGGREFVERYKKLYGKEPSEAYALYGYECGRVALEAVRTAGKKDRDAVRRAGIAIKDFPGVTGTFSFDPNGDTTLLEMSGIAVRDGKFVFAKKLTVTRK
jgi:branched-chain amino acid transport system substrate-binding protein